MMVCVNEEDALGRVGTIYGPKAGDVLMQKGDGNDFGTEDVDVDWRTLGLGDDWNQHHDERRRSEGRRLI